MIWFEFWCLELFQRLVLLFYLSFWLIFHSFRIWIILEGCFASSTNFIEESRFKPLASIAKKNIIKNIPSWGESIIWHGLGIMYSLSLIFWTRLPCSSFIIASLIFLLLLASGSTIFLETDAWFSMYGFSILGWKEHCW